MSSQPAAGGGRWVEVGPDRLEGWLARFDARHRVVRTRYRGSVVDVEAADGALAECHPPFPPVEAAGDHDGLAAAPLVAHARRERVVGVVLVRLGGHAAGVFRGDRLIASKVGRRLVHGRHSAGGWSQQRFERRRAGQARVAQQAAADEAANVLLPRLSELEAVILGGDRRAVDEVARDRRLAPLLELAVDRFLTVPDPRLEVLRRTPRTFRAVRIRVVEPPAMVP
ncbi:MAG TPA: acVLRF1 family peptidyl-tRNA hydrolase [Candidatus Binatia bacterium]|nr:acVLRF1 family peptidyl-tRNA hydrolase [Candidatus Binatia bacterium]